MMPRRKTGRKRRNGEGGIYRRRDGRYEAKVTGSDGRRISIYAKTFEAVEAKLQEARTRVRQGGSVPRTSYRVDDLAAEWLEHQKSRIRYKTWNGYQGIVNKHLSPRIGQKPVFYLGVADVERMYTDLVGSGVSVGNLGTIHRCLNAMLNTGLRWGILDRNVASLAERPRPQRKEMLVLTEQQCKDLRLSAREHRLGALIEMALLTGCRRGELLGLSWSDIDEVNREINIRQSLQESEGGWTLGEPKTPSSIRVVPLSGDAADVLRRHRVVQDEERKRAGKLWDNLHGLIFTTTIGTPLDAHNILRRDFRPIVKSAGLPSALRFHDMRHTFASLSLSAGQPVTEVSKVMGHVDASVTLSRYGHSIPGRASLVTDAIEKMIAV